MSLHSENNVIMTCAEFEASFDQYVDETLAATMMDACSCHLAKCPPCDREVSRWQQTRILLSTAVADFSTAVDVSSVRSDVFAALGMDEAGDRRRSATREAAFDRGSSSHRSTDRGTRRAAGGRRGAFGAVLRFTSAASVSAIAAAMAVMVLSPAQQTEKPGMQVLASARPSYQSSSYQPVAYTKWSKSRFGDVAPAAYTRPPLAKPEVSHVDGLEAAPGHQVSTWVQPRTNARVIWVQDRGLGAPVRMAGLGK